MKNWATLVPDVTLLMNKHYTPASGRKIDKIVVHHNAGNLSVRDCYNTWQTREASAHYQVESDGTIGQLVRDKDIAWHAGNANSTSIGIEHANNKMSPSWTISEKTLDNGAHLVAALCRYYELGRPQWKKNVFPHSYFNSTACPGAIAGSQNTEYITRAQYWYDQMALPTKKELKDMSMALYTIPTRAAGKNTWLTNTSEGWSTAAIPHKKVKDVYLPHAAKWIADGNLAGCTEAQNAAINVILGMVMEAKREFDRKTFETLLKGLQK